MTDLVRILIGPLVWLGSFSAVYGLHGAACSFGWAEIEVGSLSLLRLALTATWLAAVALQVVVLVSLRSRRFVSPSVFARGVSRTTGWVGLVATLWSLFPVVAMSACQ